MNSDDVHDFLEGRLQRAQLHHRDHLYLAWHLARQYDEQTALDLMSRGIRTWASQHGHIAQYNEALTRFWVQRVAQAMSQHPDLNDFETFLEACPHLLDKNLPSTGG